MRITFMKFELAVAVFCSLFSLPLVGPGAFLGRLVVRSVANTLPIRYHSQGTFIPLFSLFGSAFCFPCTIPCLLLGLLVVSYMLDSLD